MDPIVIMMKTPYGWEHRELKVFSLVCPKINITLTNEADKVVTPPPS
jgi:hypothetical protein